MARHAARHAARRPRRARRAGSQLALATPVVLWGGWPFFARGWASLAHRQPQHVHADRARHGRRVRLQRRRRRSRPASSRRRSAAHGGAVPVYFEAAAVIVTLVLLGQVLELRARAPHRRRDPRAARPRAEDRAPHRRGRHASADVPLEQVAVGDRLRVRPGREGPGRRRRARGRERGRRVDAHRRADPGREGGRATASIGAHRRTAPARS